jgi:POT family proton-dependent oligopeptide transporter
MARAAAVPADPVPPPPAASPDEVVVAGGDRAFFGHPRGLGYLAFTEAWERFSFSGMSVLLVLYMVDRLLRPGYVEHVVGFAGFERMLAAVYGPLAPQPLSSVVYGLYASLAFFMPVFGGVLGDRVFGQRRMVVAGAVLMAAGHFMMAFDATFLLALVLLIAGTGCLKGNISTQVGALYADEDRRRTDAFQIFSVATNTGVIAAPLVCGALGETLGWHWGFGAAGVGMLVGLATYLAGMRSLPPDRPRPRSSPRSRREKAAPLLAPDRRMILVLAAVFLLTTAFLTAAGQLGNVYSLWLQSDVDRRVGRLEIPVTWFQAITPIWSALMTPLFLKRWQAQARRGREPAMMAKMAQGMALAALGMGWLAALAVAAQGGGKVGWLWLLPTHLLVSTAYLMVYPVGLALFSRAAPQGARALYIGLFFLTSFVAGNVVGGWGRFYSAGPAASFWMSQAAFGVAAAVVALALQRPLTRLLVRAEGAHASSP